MSLSRATQADLVEHCKAAVFSVRPKSNFMERGTAVAIRSNLLITCHHVVRGTEQVILVSHDPVLEGKKSARAGAAEVVGVDEDLDLALLRSKVHLPTSLQLAEGEAPDDSMPLLVWSWPGWNALEQGEVDPSAIVVDSELLAAAPHAAVITDSWRTENDISKFSFAGHIEGGMSGGAVVSALSGKIVGVVTSSWTVSNPETAREIAETWHLGEWSWSLSEQELESRLDPRPETVKAIEAQLRLGMGIALSIDEVRTFLNAKVPEVL